MIFKVPGIKNHTEIGNKHSAEPNTGKNTICIDFLMVFELSMDPKAIPRALKNASPKQQKKGTKKNIEKITCLSM